MNKKAIHSVLSKKFAEWLGSIADEVVRDKVKNGAFITGGAIASLLLGEEVHDYDVYFKDYATCYTVALYYVEQFNKEHHTKFTIEVTEEKRIKVFIQSTGEAGDMPEDEVADELQTNITPDSDTENIPEKPSYRAVYLTSNAITLSNKIQLVIRFYGEPKEIHSNYDFVHCTNYWTPTERLVTNAEALESLLAKELRYVGSKYPLCSVIRTRKFIGRGWHINAGQYLKMLMQVSLLDLTKVDVLEEQLIGVDSAYFGMLIKALRTQTENTKTDTVDNSYVAAIIDKIF